MSEPDVYDCARSGSVGPGDGSVSDGRWSGVQRFDVLYSQRCPRPNARRCSRHRKYVDGKDAGELDGR